jgi:hypothetical protein
VQVTGDPAFSMFNLSLREEWLNNKKFCHRLSDDEVKQTFFFDDFARCLFFLLGGYVDLLV